MKIWKEKDFMKLKNLFSNLYWKKRYNTLENKYETEIQAKLKAKEKTIELQEKYITLLEKVEDIDKLFKKMNLKFNELEMKEKK